MADPAGDQCWGGSRAQWRKRLPRQEAAQQAPVSHQHRITVRNNHSRHHLDGFPGRTRESELLSSSSGAMAGIRPVGPSRLARASAAPHRVGRLLDRWIGRSARSLSGSGGDIHLQGWIVTEPGPNLLQGIPWKRKRCEDLRGRVLNIGLQRQHPLGNAVTKGETNQGDPPRNLPWPQREHQGTGVAHKFFRSM